MHDTIPAMTDSIMTDTLLDALNLTSHNLSTRVEEPSDQQQRCDLFDFVTCGVVVGTLCVLGITGNLTAFMVLFKHKSETATMFLLEVLAVSDSVLLLCSLPIYVFPQAYMHVSNEVFFSFYRYVQTFIWPVSMMAHTTTVWITVLVTLNRYYAVCHLIGPYRSYVLQATRLQVVGVITFSVLYNCPRFFEHQPIRREKYIDMETNETKIRSTNLGDNKLYQIVYSNVLYYPVMYIVPFFILLYLNFRLIRALNEIRLRKEALTGHRARDDNITVIVVVIVCVFIVCQTPALVNQIFWAVTTNEQRACGYFHFYYTKISDILVVLNSSTNFVIYCLFGKTFRRVFVEVLCKRPFYRSHRNDPSAQPLNDL